MAEVPPDADRLIQEWSRDKVRIRWNGELWWRWDSSGYTQDMASAGLYEADWKPWRKEDKVVPVDPERFAIDKIMARLASEQSVVSSMRGRVAHHSHAAESMAKELDAMKAERDRLLTVAKAAHAYCYGPAGDDGYGLDAMMEALAAAKLSKTTKESP